MIESVTPDQFRVIMNTIKKDHRLVDGRCIKYVNTSFDLRDCTFWKFVFRVWSTEVVFTTSNRGSVQENGTWVDDKGLLFDEIMKWLEEGKKLNPKET